MELFLSIDVVSAMDKPINTRPHWNARFSSKDWENSQGKLQTLFFAQLAIDNIPSWLKVYIEFENLSICDFSCALGYASKLLSTTFPNSDITGQDISESGIEEAKKLFPELKFTSEDLLQSTVEKYDILFSSQTLGHFYEPHASISKLANSAKKLLIFLLPFYADLKIEEHFYSLTYENIPRVISDKFSLLFYKEIDASRIPGTHWNGRQILLVYATDTVIDALETNADSQISCNNLKKEARLIHIDSILRAESERKISEFLSLPREEQLAQTFAQEETEDPASKQQPESFTSFGNSVFNRFSWRLVCLFRQFFKNIKKLVNMIRITVNCSTMRRINLSKPKYVLYKLYLKSPPLLKKTSNTLYKKITFKGFRKSGDEVTIDLNTIDFIKRIRNSIDISNTFFYIQSTIFSFSGDDFFSGGAERYALDLNKLVSKMGYTFIGIQKCAGQAWIRNYHGLTVIGLPSFTDEALFQKCSALLVKNSKLIMSSPFTLMVKKCGTKNIGISHGIYWDREFLSHKATFIASQVKHFDKLVSVDTATVNFIRGHHPSYAMHMDYIPNYVDHSLFTIKNNNHPSEINVLYPRRLYGPRGFWLVVRVLPRILNEFENVKFIFCGKGDDNEIKKIRGLEKKYFPRVKHIVCDPYEMDTIYQQADIVLIPTIHSEGTSLSLIEAMASKKAIIATCVGGITDLVTDMFTGILIKPDDEHELIAAIKKLIVGKDLREELAENAYKKSLSFSIDVWENKWKKAIASVVDFSPRDPLNCFYNFSLLHLPAEGVFFDTTKQRSQQLFNAFSHYVKCFFIEDKKGSSQQLIKERLILSERDVSVDTSGMICYTSLASNVDLIKKKKNKLLIYDVVDHLIIQASPAYLEQHNEMLRLASIIITNSTTLFEEYKNIYQRKTIKYIPNMVVTEDLSENQTYKNLNDLDVSGEYTFIAAYEASAKALKISKDKRYFKNMKKEAEENAWNTIAKVIIEAINENLNVS